MSEWVAIDFETATSERASACALGVVAVAAGAMFEHRRWLIQPPENEYDPWNTAIHGIGAADTVDAPTFPQVWAEIETFIGGRSMVAHNAGFDLSVLRAECRVHGLSPRDTPYACTLVLGRRQWHGLPSYANRPKDSLDRNPDQPRRIPV
jgi:DNA polymerase-3 subunit epsilon